MTISLPSTDFGVDIPFVTHGGAVMTRLDVTMAMAARSDHVDTVVMT